MYHSKQTGKFRNKIRPWQLKPVRAPCQQSLAFGYSTSAEVRVAATSKDWLDLDRASISPPRSRRRRTEAVFAGCCHRRYKGYYMPACGYEFYLRVFNSILTIDYCRSSGCGYFKGLTRFRQSLHFSSSIKKKTTGGCARRVLSEEIWRILHARLWIRILSSSFQLDISRVSAANVLFII